MIPLRLPAALPDSGARVCCPADNKPYIDLEFFRGLQDKFRAPGDFAQAYVIAHEVGHHVQNQLGIAEQVRSLQSRVGEREANALQVRMALQADCFAGIWAATANRDRRLLELGDVEEGLRAARERAAAPTYNAALAPALDPRMSFLSLLIAFALEQWRPLVDRRALFAPMAGYAGLLERSFDAGEAQQGAIAWFLAVVPAALLAWAVYAVLVAVNPFLGLAFNVLVLYFTLGFRQHSHYFTDIHKALRDGDPATARRLLAQWRGHPCDTLSSAEVARLAIEGALTVSHRHVFGPMFWFVLLPGPSGAVLYRFALFLSRRWGGMGRAGDAGPIVDLPGAGDAAADVAGPVTHAAMERDEAAETSRFGEFARAAFGVIDWLPARITATAFAVVGDFEDAIYCWRTQAARWPDRILGVVLAAGAGAIGVRLGMPVPRGAALEDRPELGLGEDADTPFLDSTVGLIWRALVLWLAALLALSLARAFG